MDIEVVVELEVLEEVIVVLDVPVDIVLQRRGGWVGGTARAAPTARWEFAKGGAKRIVRFWGGKTYHKAPPPNQFWRPQKVGFVWSVPVSSKENDIA